MFIKFVCLSALLTLVVLAALLWPLLRPRKAKSESGSQVSLELLRRQFAELEAAYKAGRVPEDEYRETRAELEVRVLDEARHDAAATDTPAPATAKLETWTIAGVILVLLPLVGYLLWSQLGTPKALDDSFMAEQTRIAQESRSNQGHSPSELSRQIKMLEDHLKDSPDNLDAWIMLSRTQAALKNWKKSSEAFAQVNRLLPNNPDVLADWADVEAAAQGGDLSGKPKELIEQALKIDDKNGKALMLMGTYCFNTRDYAGAVAYWERILPLLEQGSEEWKTIAESIEDARRAGGIVSTAPAGMMLQAPPTVTAQPNAKEEPSNAFLEGAVELSDKVKSKLRPGDVLFIYARPVQGSKMPVAFERYPVKDWPVKFHLDDRNTMASGMTTLADTEQVVVEARISHSGNFMPASGDLQGAAAQPVKKGTSGIKVVIDTVLP